MIILRFLLSAFVLWVGSILSPETIIFTDTKALIVTTLLLYGVELLISLICTGGVVGIVALVNNLIVNMSEVLRLIVNVLVVISIIVIALTINIISLYIVSKYYVGFEVTNTYHMIFLAIALSATSMGNKNNKEDT